jgi:Tfp pilus assembly protein FimT
MWNFDGRTLVAPRLLNGPLVVFRLGPQILLTMTIRMKNKPLPRTLRGFSTLELIITATILTIVTGLGLMGITRAKASIRLAGSAREFASYIEKARVYSIRRHADEASKRANVAINDDKTSYNVSMDLDGDGGMDTRTINLPSGIVFDTVETIAFDWRGRTWNTASGTTEPNAQVSITLKYGTDAVSVDVTGSGDITIDSRVFDDEVPQVHLNVGDLAAGATPVPTPDPTTPAPTPDPTGTVDGTNPTSTPTPTPTPGSTPVSTPTPTPTPTSTPKPTPTPHATPTPTPTPEVCTITTSPSSLSLTLLGTGTIKVSHSSSSSVSISASSSKSSDLQVTPTSAQTVSAGGSATFTLKSKKAIGIYSVTFSAGCGSKTVPVVVIL